MNDFLERLAKISSARRWGGAVAIYAIVALLWGLLFIRPTWIARGDLEEANRELTVERADKERKAKNREKFERELEEIEGELAQMVRQLPQSQEIPQLLDAVSQVGRKLGLEFVKWKSQRETAKEFYAEVPVELEVEGSYHDVAMFFDKIANLDRIINVRDVRIGSPLEENGKISLHTEGQIVAFRQLTEQELMAARAASEEQAKNKGAKGRR